MAIKKKRKHNPHLTLVDTYYTDSEEYKQHEREKNFIGKIASGIIVTVGIVCMFCGIVVGKNLK